MLIDMQNVENVRAFASKYLRLYESRATDERDVEQGFDDACFDFGFEMDCGERFIDHYSERAFYEAEELLRVVDDIDDVDLLGSAIFSRWRYVTHWADYESLLDEKHRSWFVVAFNRLLKITSKEHDASQDREHVGWRDEEFTPEIEDALSCLFHEADPTMLGVQTTVDDLIAAALCSGWLPADVEGVLKDEEKVELIDYYFDDYADCSGFAVDWSRSSDGFVLFKRVSGSEVPQLEEMESLSFTTGGFHQGLAFIEVLEVEDNYVVKCGTAGCGDDSATVRQLTNAEISTLTATLERLGVTRWSDRYVSSALDGTQWSIRLRFKGGLEFTSFGSNAYPKGFGALLSAMIALGMPE